MNKKRKISVTGIAMMILTMFLYGCEPEPVPVTGISLDTTELSLAVGESADLKVTVEPADATEKTVTWNAEPAGIVKVTPGKDGCFTLRGLNSGNAVFGVTAGDRTADCIVSVSSLRLNRTAASLLFDETVDLTALVSADAAEQTVSWSAEPAGAVELDFEGNFCTVIPVDNGTVTVTASAGPAKAVCTINSRVFVDDAFVAAVGEQCATWKKESNGRVKLTPENREAMKAVTNLNLNGKGLTDLSDIEWFTGLTDLFCDNNPLTELDVSNCTALTELDCQDNQLTALDVSANTALTELDCRVNQLISLNVSGCTVLTILDCRINQLTELDVSANTALTALECSNNQLTALDVSNCTVLTGLGCGDNHLAELDVSDCTALTTLECSNNQLMSLDVSKNTALVTLWGYDNRLTALDVSACTSLGYLYCGDQTSDGTTAQTLTLT
ncbi:MAG: Ig-like domain-containing protein, partial [Spirochaetia bacterium]|nr:Ig-like domain-containing protein [Spirochaetia bacterium]